MITAKLAVEGSGSDNAPTLAQFQRYGTTDEIHYFIVGNGSGSGDGETAKPTGSVARSLPGSRPTSPPAPSADRLSTTSPSPDDLISRSTLHAPTLRAGHAASTSAPRHRRPQPPRPCGHRVGARVRGHRRVLHGGTRAGPCAPGVCVRPNGGTEPST